MACIIELGSPAIRLDFVKNRKKQPLLIKALLQFSTLDLDNLATLLNVPVTLLMGVLNGNNYLSLEEANHLGQLFLLTFCD